VRDDKYWMKKVFVGKTTDEVSRMDWDKAGVEGVSGATQTSYAMAEGLKRRFAAETRRGAEPGGRARTIGRSALSCSARV
jgi:hypothetical protein